jgi:hypothetical protein
MKNLIIKYNQIGTDTYLSIYKKEISPLFQKIEN